MDDEIFESDAVRELTEDDNGPSAESGSSEPTVDDETAVAETAEESDEEPGELVTVLTEAFDSGSRTPPEKPKWSKKKKIIVIILIILAAVIVVIGIMALIVYMIMMAIIQASTVVIQSITEEIVTDLAEEIIRGLSDIRIF